MKVRILAGATERIQTLAVKGGNLAPITGSATIVIAIQRVSDNQWLDWNDMSFKAAAWVTRQLVMTEVDAVLAPGEYYADFDTSALTNATQDDTYMVRIDDTSGTAKNTPMHGELALGQWIVQQHGVTQL